MSNENSEKPQNEGLVSLRAFIETYHKTIAVTGVFVALGLFWKTIAGQDDIPYISYLCFLITIPLLLEVNKGYEYEKSSWNLIAFINIFYGILLLTIYNLVVNYPNHLEKIIPGTVWAVILFGLSTLADKFVTKLKTNARNRVVDQVEALDKNLPIVEKQKIVTQWNAGLERQYKFATAFEVSLIVLIFIFAFAMAGLVSNYSHGIIDVLLDRDDEVVAPPPSK